MVCTSYEYSIAAFVGDPYLYVCIYIHAYTCMYMYIAPTICYALATSIEYSSCICRGSIFVHYQICKRWASNFAGFVYAVCREKGSFGGKIQETSHLCFISFSLSLSHTHTHTHTRTHTRTRTRTCTRTRKKKTHTHIHTRIHKHTHLTHLPHLCFLASLFLLNFSQRQRSIPSLFIQNIPRI